MLDMVRSTGQPSNEQGWEEDMISGDDEQELLGLLDDFYTE
jgi:hypothetical protein